MACEKIEVLRWQKSNPNRKVFNEWKKAQKGTLEEACQREAR